METPDADHDRAAASPYGDRLLRNGDGGAEMAECRGDRGRLLHIHVIQPARDSSRRGQEQTLMNTRSRLAYRLGLGGAVLLIAAGPSAAQAPAAVPVTATSAQA